MTLFHVHILSAALSNKATGLAFVTDQEHLGAAIAAVTDVPRMVTVWVLPVQADQADELGVPRFDDDALEQIKDALSEPFVERAVTSADDPTGAAHARRFAELLVRAYGGHIEQEPGAVCFHLPDAKGPEVVIVHPTTPNTSPCIN